MTAKQTRHRALLSLRLLAYRVGTKQSNLSTRMNISDSQIIKTLLPCRESTHPSYNQQSLTTNSLDYFTTEVRNTLRARCDRKMIEV